MANSMISGVTGLKTHQSKMNTIGNNIANVNTLGYKGASVTFQDTMYQTVSSGSSGNTEAGGLGGTNANQVGYGVTTGAITYDFSGGGLTSSSSGLHCMIDGTGFYIVGSMVEGGTISLSDDDAVKTSGLKLSRVGQFKVDDNGYLTDSEGNYVYGFVNTGDLTSSDGITTDSIAPIKIPTNADMASLNNSDATTAIATAKKALEAAKVALTTANASLASTRQAYIDANTAYEKAYKAADIKTLTEACSDAKEAKETAYAKYAADLSDTTLAADYYKAEHDYQVANYKLSQAVATVNSPAALKAYDGTTTLADNLADYNAAYTAFAAADPTDADYETKKTAWTDALTPLQTVEKALSTVEDDSLSGKLAAAKQAAAAAESVVKSAEEKVTSATNSVTLAQNSATSKSVSNAAASDDNPASLNSYSIGTDGSVTATTSGGVSIIIGKVALANVQNTGGLLKSSGYCYSIESNSGNVSVYQAGGSEATIKNYYLETSTVDLATEMTDMITTQRGFQASSKIITVTDSMMEELVNMKR